MKLSIIVDSLIRNVQGGKTSQGSVFDPTYIKNMVHPFRAAAIKQEFNKNMQIQTSWLQMCYLSYSKSLQYSAPTGAVIFQFPPIISLGKQDGIRFIGTIGGGNQGQNQSQYPCTKTWNRIMSRGELVTLNSHPFTKFSNNPYEVYVLYDFTNNRVEVYNDPLCTEGKVEAVFSDPTQVITNGGVWNEEVDDYPCDEGLLTIIKSLIYEERTAVDKATKPEINSNVPEINVTKPLKPQVIPAQQ